MTRARVDSPHERVDVAPLRDAVLASGLTLGEIAVRLGWMRRDAKHRHPIGDESRLRRRLGLRPTTSKGKHQTSRYITYETAVKIARAAHIDPVDIGL